MISVITPTYNRVDYLGNAIDSVLAQTYNDWELLVWMTISQTRKPERLLPQ